MALASRLVLVLGASGALHSPRLLCDVRTPSAVIDVDALGMSLDALAACGVDDGATREMLLRALSAAVASQLQLWPAEG